MVLFHRVVFHVFISMNRFSGQEKGEGSARSLHNGPSRAGQQCERSDSMAAPHSRIRRYYSAVAKLLGVGHIKPVQETKKKKLKGRELRLLSLFIMEIFE